LYALEQPEHCSAWTAFLPATAGTTHCHEALQGIKFVVYAGDENAARQYLKTILLCTDANYPVGELVLAKSPKDEQPVRPVRPGVQCAVRHSR
jgi:hypothetical protein